MDSEDNVTFFNENAPAANDVRGYARQLSERKRLQDERRKEDNFLRRSLRQSEKLRSLARAKKAVKESKVATAHNNLAFDDEDEVQYKFKPINYTEFIPYLRGLLKKQDSPRDGFSDVDESGDLEWEWLTTKVSDQSVLRAFNLYDVVPLVLERTRAKMGALPMEKWAGDVSAVQSYRALTWSLQNVPANNRTSQINELFAILNKPVMMALISAIDDVKKIWTIEAERKDNLDDDIVERTVYPSPVDGCYKILAVDDQGNTVSTPDGTTLVNVILQKSGEDFFGATVRNEGSAIVIGRIISGGLIERTGLLNEGDELLSVNGIDLMGKDVDHVSYILSDLNGHIDLLVAPIVPITEASLYQDEPVAHLRALFSYEPSNDVYNPCPEASVAFDKGDILRILNTRDPNWWQALRIEESGAVGVTKTMAGLVPSPYFQRYRCLLRLKRAGAYAEDAAAGYSESEASEQDEGDAESEQGLADGDASSLGAPRSEEYLWSSHGVGPKQLKKLRHRRSHGSRLLSIVTARSGGRFSRSSRLRSNEYEVSKEINSLKQTDGDQLRQLVEESVGDKIRRPSLLTYELVDLYYPQPQRKRPLVLVGPKHVGRQQLIEGLLRSEPKRFTMPVIHTTNSEAAPTNFQRYEIVTKAEFLRLHKERAFVEWGVFNRHYYGTKVTSIESVVKAGQVCVLALRPDSIRAIRRTPFLPCVIFVSPPDNLDEMRKLSKQWINSTANIPDEELKACMEESQKMEQHYGHFFEFLIVPRTPETALAELKQAALELERRPQWVPAQWIDLAWQVAAQAMREAKAASANNSSSADATLITSG